MAGRVGGSNRGQRRPDGRGRGGAARRVGGGESAGQARARTGLSVRKVEGNDFELVHPPCVAQRELDYQEGIEMLRAGDPEGAQDALRFEPKGGHSEFSRINQLSLGLLSLPNKR